MAIKIAELIENLFLEEVKEVNNILENIEGEIDDYIDHHRKLVEDYKSENLIVGTAEAEGFLRACITLKNLIQQYKKDYL